MPSLPASASAELYKRLQDSIRSLTPHGHGLVGAVANSQWGELALCTSCSGFQGFQCFHG